MFNFEELSQYRVFLETYEGPRRAEVSQSTLVYVNNARVLHANFRSAPGFDWSLVIVELGKAVEQEFRPRFVRIAENAREIIEKSNRRKKLEEMTLGVWAGILQDTARYPNIGLATETRVLLAERLKEITRLRNNAAHALDTLPGRDNAIAMSGHVLAIPDGFLAQTLPLRV